MGDMVGSATPAKTLGPDLLAFLGEALFNDLSNSTTVAEAAELARGFKAAADMLLQLEQLGVVAHFDLNLDANRWRVSVASSPSRTLEGVGKSGIGAVAEATGALLEELANHNA